MKVRTETIAEAACQFLGRLHYEQYRGKELPDRGKRNRRSLLISILLALRTSDPHPQNYEWKLLYIHIHSLYLYLQRKTNFN
jgi:hypothetical protein